MNQQVDNAIGGFDEPAKAARPVFSQRMKFHLNCGQDGHRYVYDIFADAKPTKISRLTSSKRGTVYADVLCCENEEFDLQGVTGAAAVDWMMGRI